MQQRTNQYDRLYRIDSLLLVVSIHSSLLATINVTNNLMERPLCFFPKEVVCGVVCDVGEV